MKFYFLFRLMLPSPKTKSQGAKNDSVFGKMKEFVGSLIFFNYFWASQINFPFRFSLERKEKRTC